MQESRRVALVTGFSAATGIAAAVARRLSSSHDLMLTGLAAYGASGPAEHDGAIGELLEDLHGQGAKVDFLDADLSEPAAPAKIVGRTIDSFGRVDALVAAHAHSGATPLEALEASEIDKHLIVNVRATLLLVKEFADAHDSALSGGRIVLFSSGQRLGPMPSELAYVASKGGLEALVGSLADALAESGTTVNAINPGPTDTGWASGEEYEAIRLRFPRGRWGSPDDAAKAVSWLLGDDAAWITGQTIDSEGGFRR